MKTLKLTLIVSLLVISSTTFATGGKKMPPEPTLIEEIIEIFTGTKK
jgi:hypothetical protein